MKIIVIGINAAGAHFITRMRRLDENATIVAYEKSNYISSSTCSLPYFISGDIKDASLLSVETPLSISRRFKVIIKTNHEVVYIDRKNKRIEVRDTLTNKKEFDNYDKLVVATGSTPFTPSPINIKSDRIYTLRNIDDAKRIKSIILNKNVKKAAVIGGGYVGLEISECLRKLGIEIHLIEKSDQVLNNLDKEVSSFVKNEVIENGVSLHLSKCLSKIEEMNDHLRIKLEDKTLLDVDLAILALGIKANSLLAKECNLGINERNLIKVNNHMQTSDLDIYAIGDCVTTFDYLSQKEKNIALASIAAKQARVAANHIKGIKDSLKKTIPTSIVKVFSLSVASTGLNEKEIKSLKKNYDKIYISPLSNLKAFSGETILIKVLFDKDDKSILGGQIVGKKGVDKRIDVLSTAIFGGLKIDELKDLSLSYAPQYSSPKDPINMVGFVADNLLNGFVKQYHFEDLPLLDKDKVTFLDVRSKSEFNSNHVDGFEINIPVDELRNNLSLLDKNKPIYVLCHSAIRSYIACRILKENSFDCFNLSGGYYLLEAINRYQ